MIYFVLDPVSDAIKIGWTANRDTMELRLCGLQTGNPNELRLLALEAGDRIAEQAIHQYFADRRIRGEWFDESILKDIRRGYHLRFDRIIAKACYEARVDLNRECAICEAIFEVKTGAIVKSLMPGRPGHDDRLHLCKKCRINPERARAKNATGIEG